MTSFCKRPRPLFGTDGLIISHRFQPLVSDHCTWRVVSTPCSLQYFTAIIKATSPQLVRSQDLDQLSWLRKSKNDQQRLVYWLSYTVIRMICLTTGRVRFYNQRWSYANSLLVGGKSLKSFKERNFVRQKFLTIALSMKHIKQELQSPPSEHFPVSEHRVFAF